MDRKSSQLARSIQQWRTLVQTNYWDLLREHNWRRELRSPISVTCVRTRRLYHGNTSSNCSSKPIDSLLIVGNLFAILYGRKTPKTKLDWVNRYLHKYCWAYVIGSRILSNGWVVKKCLLVNLVYAIFLFIFELLLVINCWTFQHTENKFILCYAVFFPSGLCTQLI